MPLSCAATASTAIGASCAVTTSANTLVPGYVKTGKRAVWQLGQVPVTDGGADGDPISGDNALFAIKGVFVP